MFMIQSLEDCVCFQIQVVKFSSCFHSFMVNSPRGKKRDGEGRLEVTEEKPGAVDEDEQKS